MAVYIMVFITLKSITTVAGEGSGTSSGFFLNTRAPGIPSNITPLNSATNVAFQMLLLSSPFADEGDRHTASQWLITLSNATGTFQWDSGQNTNDLIQLTVPASLSYFASRYFWQVQHKDNHGMWSGYSAQTWFDTGLPAPPDIAASDGLYSDGISITWSVSPGAEMYRVYRYETMSTSGCIRISGDVSTTTFTDSTVIPGLMYYYRVQAGKDADWGVLSQSDSGYALFAATKGSVWKYKDGKKVDVVKGKGIVPSFTSNLVEGWQIGIASKAVDGTLTNFSGPYLLDNLRNKNTGWLYKIPKELIIKYKAKKDRLTYKLWKQMPESKVVYLINPDNSYNQPSGFSPCNRHILGLELKSTEPSGTAGWQILLPVILTEE